MHFYSNCFMHLLLLYCYWPCVLNLCFFRPVDISVPGLCWAADAKLAGGGGSPWRHDSSCPAGSFAESEISLSVLLLVNVNWVFEDLVSKQNCCIYLRFFDLMFVVSWHTVYSKVSLEIQSNS